MSSTFVDAHAIPSVFCHFHGPNKWDPCMEVTILPLTISMSLPCALPLPCLSPVRRRQPNPAAPSRPRAYAARAPSRSRVTVVALPLPGAEAQRAPSGDSNLQMFAANTFPSSPRPARSGGPAPHTSPNDDDDGDKEGRRRQRIHGDTRELRVVGGDPDLLAPEHG
jgi:hypothetical protein